MGSPLKGKDVGECPRGSKEKGEWDMGSWISFEGSGVSDGVGQSGKVRVGVKGVEVPV